MGTSPSKVELAALAAVLAVVTARGGDSGGERAFEVGPGPTSRPGPSLWAFYGRIRLMEGRGGAGGRGRGRPGVGGGGAG